MGMQKRIGEGDPYFSMIRQSWGSGMRKLFAELPNPDWMS
jgi:putative proteasome-type protease